MSILKRIFRNPKNVALLVMTLLTITSLAYAASTKLSALTSATGLSLTDIFYLVIDTGGGVLADRKATLSEVMKIIPVDENELVNTNGSLGLANHATARTALGLGSAATRAAEDTLTDGSNLPDGAAIKAYGDSNWDDTSAITSAVSTHAGAADPHTGYLLESAFTTHEGASDPHTGYMLESNIGTGASNYVQLDGTGKLPAIDGSQLTNIASNGDIIQEGNSSVEVTDAGTGQVDINVDGANVVTYTSTGATMVAVEDPLLKFDALDAQDTDWWAGTNADAGATSNDSFEIRRSATTGNSVDFRTTLNGSLWITQDYEEMQLPVFGWTTDATTGTGKFYFRIGKKLAGLNLVYVHAEVITAGTTGTLNIDLHNVTQSNADILSTNLTIDSTETGSDTAAAAVVIDPDEDDMQENDVIRLDVDAVHTTASQGLLVTLGFDIP